MNNPKKINRSASSLALRDWALFLVAATLFSGKPIFAADALAGSTNSVADLSLEELINLRVTSVSKKETGLFTSPAAISVVTQDDIRRLGITTLPEALRLVPGMEVARINSHNYAVSTRGFMGQFSDKMLVMIDGRTIYEPTFSGVQWGIQDLMLEDLDRIEVIRGPGATLWGANAVNGVVNIITKSAKETQGVLVSTSVGTEDRPSTAIRYGGQLATNVYYRAYVKYFDRNRLVTSSGAGAPDDWNMTRGGYRVDWEASDQNLLTLQGDYFYNEARKSVTHSQLTNPFTRTFNVVDYNNGGNILGRWTHTYSDSAQLSVQTYYTRSQFFQDLNQITSDTLDFELQDRFALGSRNDFIWGAGYRLISDNLTPSDTTVFTPQSSARNLYTLFAQNDTALVPDRLHLILGAKLEHNDQTGFEVQPGARLLFTPTERQTLWAAVSRAVRTPDRFERGGRANVAVFPTGPGSPPVEIAPTGSSNLKAEELFAYELGYRIEPARRLSIDVTTFYNVYDNLIDFSRGTTNFEASPFPPHVLVSQNAANGPGGQSYGAEISVQWSVTDYWRLAADYSWLHLRFLDGTMEFDSPAHQAHLRSYLTLPGNLELNTVVSYVDRLRTKNIPAYVRLDLGLIWHPTKSLEIGVWAQNLLQDRHPEFTDLNSDINTEVPRGIVGKVTWRF